MPSDFHEVRFPTAVSLESRGGPVRKTEIIPLGSGRERRNARWFHGRRRYEAGYGIKSLNDLHAIIHFFEERRGRLYGFRWKDRVDYKSCEPAAIPAATNQVIGTGNGVLNTFQLVKKYGDSFAPYTRLIRKPVFGTVRIAVAGNVLAENAAWSVDITTGIITFANGFIPPSAAQITAGYEFDVPVRFDTDELDIDVSSFHAGAVPKIPLIEIVI